MLINYSDYEARTTKKREAVRYERLFILAGSGKPFLQTSTNNSHFNA